MARDPQGALVALNRFGFGARGDASGDFASAASDPRGFVKAELERPASALLESAALRSSPDLGKAFFTFREEERKQRLAADKNAVLSARASISVENMKPADAKVAETKSAELKADGNPAEAKQVAAPV